MRVPIVVGENNLRSQKALEKIGARFLEKVERPAADGTITPNSVFIIECDASRRKSLLKRL
jgi:RimJ/RimL family protein N-acetyltransferase